jgi:enoyl-CoA hydratase/carnithine racemase
MLRAIAQALDRVHAGRRPLVVASDHPRIFLAGAHLAEIAALDGRTSGGYARRGRAVLRRFESHPGPVVAAVHGPCTGGGLDLVLSCDAIVASPSASFSHPGIRRGLVTGWRGTVMLPWSIGRGAARRALLTGEPISAAEAADHGLVIVNDDPVAAARLEAARLAALHPARLMRWRSFKNSRFVDRFRAVVVHNEGWQNPCERQEIP